MSHTSSGGGGTRGTVSPCSCSSLLLVRLLGNAGSGRQGQGDTSHTVQGRQSARHGVTAGTAPWVPAAAPRCSLFACRETQEVVGKCKEMSQTLARGDGRCGTGRQHTRCGGSLWLLYVCALKDVEQSNFTCLTCYMHPPPEEAAHTALSAAELFVCLLCMEEHEDVQLARRRCTGRSVLGMLACLCWEKKE
eukprot:1153816-Pelagomonas_calceolata.AAC.3